mmetsp:Transcript_93719/g.235330  ORF Transcript_93719/g.235330 Transcript_93719/m.235330 type:complete len:203 (+) Transcript_93719:545-1153(+)
MPLTRNIASPAKAVARPERNQLAELGSAAAEHEGHENSSLGSSDCDVADEGCDGAVVEAEDDDDEPGGDSTAFGSPTRTSSCNRGKRFCSCLTAPAQLRHKGFFDHRDARASHAPAATSSPMAKQKLVSSLNSASCRLSKTRPCSSSASMDTNGPPSGACGAPGVLNSPLTANSLYKLFPERSCTMKIAMFRFSLVNQFGPE